MKPEQPKIVVCYSCGGTGKSKKYARKPVPCKVCGGSGQLVSTKERREQK